MIRRLVITTIVFIIPSLLSAGGREEVPSAEKGNTVSKKVEESGREKRTEAVEDAAAVDLSTLKTLQDVIRGAEGKKIVYVGENHDRYSHHMVQLQVIKGLYGHDKKIAVGMEMFQRPFQAALDDYIAGTIDEREFLKRSEYFKRWGFDYHLYKPILDFARAEKIPVVALNIRQEIADKVAKSGVGSLTQEERREIPVQMDFSDEEYRQRLKAVFDKHKGLGEKNFDFFYEAQVLWDETMSQSIDEFLKKDPDCRMIVLAGGGHLAHGSGIPKRTLRRNGYEYVIILNDADIEKDIARYIVYPKSIEAAAAPKLMALLKETDGRVVIEGFPPDSISKKAGLSVGDTIIALDGDSVGNVDDVKIALFSKKPGDTLKVKVLHKRFLLGETEREIDVKLP